jgi:HemY protein
MIKIILYVMSLIVLVTVSVWFSNEPGAVTINWIGWRVNTSVAVLFALLGVLLVIVTFLVRIWSTLVCAGRAYKDSRRDKRIDKGLRSLMSGFAGVRGGDVAAAKKGVREASAAFAEHDIVRLLRQQTMNVLSGVRTTNTEVLELLSDPATELAALRDLTETAASADDLDGALSHAERALSNNAAPLWALKTVLDLQVALGKWGAVATTLDRKDAPRLLGDADQLRLRAEACLRAGATALANQDSAAAIKWAYRALTAGPSRAEASAILACGLMAEGKSKKAASELERAWAKNPHPSVLSTYLQLAPGEAALEQANRVEKLVAGNLNHPESRLAQAEAWLNAKLWGQARSRLELLLDKGMKPSIRARAASLMAQIEIGGSGDTKAATQYMVIALEGRSAAKDLPAPTCIAELLSQTP